MGSNLRSRKLIAVVRRTRNMRKVIDFLNWARMAFLWCNFPYYNFYGTLKHVKMSNRCQEIESFLESLWNSVIHSTCVMY